MVKSLKYIIVIVAIASIGLGQYKTERTFEGDLFNDSARADSGIRTLFDPSRFSMNHSFSMSMMSMGSQSIGVASYTNNMNFTLRDNLKLQTYMTFMQPKMISSTASSPYQSSQMYFNAALDYTPSPNTHLKISFGNYPLYRSYHSSPFLLNSSY